MYYPHFHTISSRLCIRLNWGRDGAQSQGIFLNAANMNYCFKNITSGDEQMDGCSSVNEIMLMHHPWVT